MNTTTEHDYSEFKETEAPGDNLLAQISVTAMDQLKAEAEVERFTDKLSEAKAKLKNLNEKLLPELMEAARQENIRTSDGLIVDMKEKIFATIPKKNSIQGYKWLEDNDHGDVIKRQLTVEFNQDQEDLSKDVEKELKEREGDLAVKTKKSVHPQTLAALIREMLGEGVPVPMDTLGAYRCKTTTVKNPTSD